MVRCRLSAAGSFQPAAHVDLSVGFTTVVPGTGRIGRFLRPLVDRELLAIAVDHDPALRVVALLTADFTSIYCANHGVTSRSLSGFRNQGPFCGARVRCSPLS